MDNFVTGFVAMLGLNALWAVGKFLYRLHNETMEDDLARERRMTNLEQRCTQNAHSVLRLNRYETQLMTVANTVGTFEAKIKELEGEVFRAQTSSDEAHKRIGEMQL